MRDAGAVRLSARSFSWMEISEWRIGMNIAPWLIAYIPIDIHVFFEVRIYALTLPKSPERRDSIVRKTHRRDELLIIRLL